MMALLAVVCSYSLYVMTPDLETVIGIMTPELNPCDTAAQLRRENVDCRWVFRETRAEDYESETSHTLDDDDDESGDEYASVDEEDESDDDKKTPDDDNNNNSSSNNNNDNDDADDDDDDDKENTE
jgi:hypothetical protein